MLDTFSLPAQRALAFARLHDWGTGAFLVHGREGERVCGLEDWCSVLRPDGSTGCEMTPASTPATISALREFGLY